MEGLRRTAQALWEANVAALVISDPNIGDHIVWRGSRPQLITTEPDNLAAFGLSATHRDRADEALPAAAIATGADLVTGDENLDDGVGALLRHR